MNRLLDTQLQTHWCPAAYLPYMVARVGVDLSGSCIEMLIPPHAHEIVDQRLDRNRLAVELLDRKVLTCPAEINRVAAPIVLEHT